MRNIFAGSPPEREPARRPVVGPRSGLAHAWARYGNAVWSPPDADEPTSELYRLTPPRRRSQLREALDAAHGAGQLREALDAATGGAEDDGPLPGHAVPHRLRWWELAARAKLVSRRAAGWAWGLATAALAVVIGSVIYGWLSSHWAAYCASGRTSAEAAAMSHPAISSPAPWLKASHAAESAAATSTASTAAVTVTLTKSRPRRVSDSISAAATAGLSSSASRCSKSARATPHSRQPPRRGTVTLTL